MAIEAKKSLTVIVPYTIITVALFVLLGIKVITWQQFIVGLGLLNVPAFFGAKPPDPPPPEAPTDEAFIINVGEVQGHAPGGTSFWPIAPGDNTRTTTMPVPKKADPSEDH